MSSQLKTLGSIELYVLQYVNLDSPRPIIFDVGANVGAFANYCFDRWPRAMLWCFEPNPFTTDALHENLKGKAALIYDVALSEHPGNATLYFDAEYDLTASLYTREKHGSRQVEVPVHTLKYYLDIAGYCDYLKIDAEGSEYEILKGAGEFLHPSTIKQIQFEFNGWNIKSDVSFLDIWELLTPRGYKISTTPDCAKIIKEYDPSLEPKFNKNNPTLVGEPVFEVWAR